MLTVADQTSVASGRASTHRHRRALLSAIGDPGNWHKPTDCRPALRDAIRQQIPSSRFQTWALLFVDRLNRDGELHRIDRAALARVTGISYRQCSRYLGDLHRLGLIERAQTARMNRRTGHYDRVVIIRAAACFRPSEQPIRIPRPPDQPKGQHRPSAYIGCEVVSGTGRDPTTGSKADEQELDEQQQRALVDAWPTLARSRTDVPLLRPGYGTNTDDPDERRRLMLDRERTPYEPPAGSLIALLMSQADPEGRY